MCLVADLQHLCADPLWRLSDQQALQRVLPALPDGECTCLTFSCHQDHQDHWSLVTVFRHSETSHGKQCKEHNGLRARTLTGTHCMRSGTPALPAVSCPRFFKRRGDVSLTHMYIQSLTVSISHYGLAMVIVPLTCHWLAAQTQIRRPRTGHAAAQVRGRGRRFLR